jgi:2-haloacid dehalogenase
LPAGVFENFSAITRNSLLHALGDNNSELKEDAIEELMRAYDNLSTFADVKPTLTRIAADPSIQAVIFSNGTKTMVSNSVQGSEDLSPHASAFQDVITVDQVQKYKPARACYEHLAQKTGKDPARMGDLWLVSGNPFDIVGARSAGMQAIWIDRVGAGWKDGATGLRPTAIVHSLEHVLKEIRDSGPGSLH